MVWSSSSFSTLPSLSRVLAQSLRRLISRRISFDRNSLEPTCFAQTMRKGGRRSAHLALLGLLLVTALLSQASSFINPSRSAGRTGGCGMMRADWGCTMHAPLVTRWLMMFPQDAAQSLDHGHKSHAEAYSWNSSCTWGDVRQTSTID